MDQRFRCVQEFELEPRDRDVQVEVLAEGGRGRIEPGRGPAILLGLAVGIGEDQILGDLAQRVVARERGDPLLLLRGGNREVGGEEQRPRQEGRDVFDKARIERAGNQPLAHDDVRLEQLHGDERERLVVVKHRRHQTGRQPRLMHERQIFIVRARQRQRPALADQTHIGQRLLDGDSALAPLDDEHEIEVAVADLADRPGRRRSSELRGDGGKPRKVVPQIAFPQNSIFVRLARRSIRRSRIALLWVSQWPML